MAARRRKSPTTEAIVEGRKKGSQKIQNTLTVHWNDLPSWQQDNHYIHTGYRPASYSFRRCFASLFYLHNETVNIYSHLIGALLFTISAAYLYTILQPRYASATSSDIRAFGSFFLGAALCLGMSATYHAISNHSPTVAKWGNKLDYVGIVCLITGSFVPSVFYGFFCQRHLQEFYWIMVFHSPFYYTYRERDADVILQICSLGSGCATVSIFDKFRTPAWRPYRAGMFVAMGLSAVFPVLHGVSLYGIQEMRGRIGLSWLVLQGFLYILGAGLYAVGLT